MTNQNSIFYCYNPNLRKFLDQNGTRWIGKGVNEKNGRNYWKFEQSARLGKLLEEYSEGFSNPQ